MQAGGQLSTEVARLRYRRLVVVLLVLVGFLTMHGFLAFSASGPVAASSHAAVMAGGDQGFWGGGVDLGTPGHGAVQPRGTAIPSDAGVVAALGGAPGHEPGDHSDVLAGCVLALVGVVGVTLAVAALRRWGVLVTGGAFRRGQLLAALSLTTPSLAPTPYRLCVMRV